MIFCSNFGFTARNPPEKAICKCLSFLQMFLQNLEKFWSLPSKKEKLLREKFYFKIKSLYSSQQHWPVVQAVVLPARDDRPGHWSQGGVYTDTSLPPETQQTMLLADVTLSSIWTLVSF